MDDRRFGGGGEGSSILIGRSKCASFSTFPPKISHVQIPVIIYYLKILNWFCVFYFIFLFFSCLGNLNVFFRNFLFVAKVAIIHGKDDGRKKWCHA
jgi:hypothetical protein